MNLSGRIKGYFCFFLDALHLGVEPRVIVDWGGNLCSGQSLGGEAPGLNPLDNIKGFFFFLGTGRARRHKTVRGRFLPEASGGMFWEAVSYLALISVRVEQTL